MIRLSGLFFCVLLARATLMAQVNVYNEHSYPSSPFKPDERRTAGFPCSMTLNAAIIGDDTKTGLIPAEITITSVTISPDGFNVFIDGNLLPGSPFMYDRSYSTSLPVFLAGNLRMHQIFVHDISEGSCTAIIPVEVPGNFGEDSNDRVFFPAADQTEVMKPVCVKPLFVFPNPVTPEDPLFAISGFDEMDLKCEGKVSVFTPQGALVTADEIFCETHVMIRLGQTLTEGIYAVNVKTKKAIYSGKLVIQ